MGLCNIYTQHNHQINNHKGQIKSYKGPNPMVKINTSNSMLENPIENFNPGLMRLNVNLDLLDKMWAERIQNKPPKNRNDDHT